MRYLIHVEGLRPSQVVSKFQSATEKEILELHQKAILSKHLLPKRAYERKNSK